MRLASNPDYKLLIQLLKYSNLYNKKFILANIFNIL